jgi:hypothetical protein
MTKQLERAGAPDEIEVTEEMIEAGVAEIATYNLDFESREEAVERIFVAMLLRGKDRSRSA